MARRLDKRGNERKKKKRIKKRTNEGKKRKRRSSLRLNGEEMETGKQTNFKPRKSNIVLLLLSGGREILHVGDGW